MELEATTAVITGSSGHLGSELALALGQQGCNCICHYHTNGQQAQQIVDRIKQTGAKAVAVQADLTDPEQIENLFDKAIKLDTPQILINSAGVFSREPLQEITLAQ